MPPRLLQLLVTALALAPLGAAHAHAEVGTEVPSLELRTPAGGLERLLAPRARATALIFVRPGQERSIEALRAMRRCEGDLPGRQLRFVAVAPGATTPPEGAALADAAGARIPLLLDDGEALYQRLGVRNHPVVFLLDARGAVAAFEQYRQIDYGEVVRARLRFLLGEIDQQALELALEPPRGTMPGDDAGDVATRDVNLGRQQLRIKQYDKALQSAGKALGRAPSAGAFALIGDVHAARGDCRKALAQYEQALKLDADEPHALAGRSKCAGR